MRLRELRQARGLTQTEVGAVIGKSAPTIYRIENGLSSVLLSDLHKLAVFYGVPVQELLDDLQMRHIRCLHSLEASSSTGQEHPHA